MRSRKDFKVAKFVPYVDCDSVYGISTGCGLDGPEIQSAAVPLLRPLVTSLLRQKHRFDSM